MTHCIPGTFETTKKRSLHFEACVWWSVWILVGLFNTSSSSATLWRAGPTPPLSSKTCFRRFLGASRIRCACTWLERCGPIVLNFCPGWAPELGSIFSTIPPPVEGEACFQLWHIDGLHRNIMDCRETPLWIGKYQHLLLVKNHIVKRSRFCLPVFLAKAYLCPKSIPSTQLSNVLVKFSIFTLVKRAGYKSQQKAWKVIVTDTMKNLSIH